MGAYDVHIGTSQSDGVDADGLQTGHDVLVNQSSVDHRHDIEHLRIGYSSPANHLALYTELRSYLRSTSSTAMHEHLRPFDGSELLQKLRELCLVLYDGTTNFDDRDCLSHFLNRRCSGRQVLRCFFFLHSCKTKKAPPRFEGEGRMVSIPDRYSHRVRSGNC